MKILKHTLRLCLLVMVFYGCTEDNVDTAFADGLEAPTDISALVMVTQDNTGLVTITPSGNGVTGYVFDFGDGSELSNSVQPGSSIEHTYAEGNYEFNIIASNLNGLSTVFTEAVVVSFQAPENLVVTITNDPAISKAVNIAAQADFATYYAVSFGEEETAEPTIFNSGDVISYTYQQAGIYTINVEAFSGAIATLSYTEDFEAVEIVQPLSSAPDQPSRLEEDVISVFSGIYTDIEGVDFNPNWGQSTTYNLFDLAGDEMLQYANLNYQGIDLSGTIDASQMEYLHIDVWTADENNASISPITAGPNDTSNETAYELELIAQQWTSFDIPLSAFTDQNPLLDFSALFQLKLEGVPNGGAIFVDNLYLYKESDESVPDVSPINFEEESGLNFTLSSFDGGAISVVGNPDLNGNSSAMVAEMIKGAGQTWAGSKINVPTPFQVIGTSVITVKVWSPRAGLNLLLKMEDNTAWPNTIETSEITATTTVANQWETLTFDFAGIDTSVDWHNLVLIMDNGTAGDGSSDYTIYVDDITIN
ncbi:hypothetical protein [Winogradskyella wichelsiae]|uniref:hypothetical protein n=1 Tax=Winogradskyella wichelsiae TaxID=2697007 RepID=UPI003EF34367